MRRKLLALVAVSLLVAGCGANRGHWEITFENKGASRCSVAVGFAQGAKGEASADGVDKGESISLISSPGSTVVETVKITIAGATQTLTPKTQLKAGDKFKITVAADGKVETTVSED